MKKVLLTLLCLFSVFAFMLSASAKEKINVYVFSKEGCPHCEEVKTFLTELEQDEEYSKYFKMVDYQVWDASWVANEDNKELLDKVSEKFGDGEITGAPYVVISDFYHVNGFAEDMQDDMKEAIKKAYNSDSYVDLVSGFTNTKENDSLSSVIGIGIILVVAGGLVALVIFSRKEN